MSENFEIKFIKPCRFESEDHRLLTPELTHFATTQGRMVQINLDNCSIQRMEMLPSVPTIHDAEKLGLLPLVKILQQGNVNLTAIGINEMPDKKVAYANTSYEKFCYYFWPGHRDDPDATHRKYDENSIERKVEFTGLSDGERCVYGVSYVPLLQIQNIKKTYPHFPPEKQFETYVHSIISMLDVISGFELELAKYAFWDLETKEINQLPDRIRERRADIKSNFIKTQSTLDKCREFAFNGAMDVFWLSSANFTEDLNHSVDINGKKFKLDNWVGTTDHKLYRISRDIHSTYHNGSSTQRLLVAREDRLLTSKYWQYVDGISKNIFEYRYKVGYGKVDNLLQKIDYAVSYIENQLNESLAKVT